MTTLRGIAWNHTRGFVSVVATAQRFEELHPEVSIQWEKRSLQAFADASMAELADRFDLIIMDHPHTALAATEGLLLPFEDWLPAEFLSDQAANSVGGSHESYRFAGKQWTLATDAATPIATWRPDLMKQNGLAQPQTWDEVLALARGGFVTVSAFPIDVLMNTYMFCEALGETPFTIDGELASHEVLAGALEELQKLVALCDPACLTRNPIRTAEWMAETSESRGAYCPFAYGYSNYSRPGYGSHLLQAGGLVTHQGKRLRSAELASQFRQRQSIRVPAWTTQSLLPRPPFRKASISNPEGNPAIGEHGRMTLSMTPAPTSFATRCKLSMSPSCAGSFLAIWRFRISRHRSPTIAWRENQSPSKPPEKSTASTGSAGKDKSNFLCSIPLLLMNINSTIRGRR